MLDFRKYACQLFEVVILAGLLEPGGAMVNNVQSSPLAVIYAQGAALAYSLVDYPESKDTGEK